MADRAARPRLGGQPPSRRRQGRLVHPQPVSGSARWLLVRLVDHNQDHPAKGLVAVEQGGAGDPAGHGPAAPVGGLDHGRLGAVLVAHGRP